MAPTAELRTPATRLIELQQQLVRADQDLEDAKAKLASYQREHDRFHRFGGVSFGGVGCAQIWADFVLWETILNENPDLRGIMEIGTWQGGFSLWLNAQAEARRMKFVTYDAITPTAKVPKFMKRDVFANPDEIGAAIRKMEPVVLLCDGGNKPRELRTFPNYFRDPRSLVVVHDWGTETMPSDVPTWLAPVYEGFCEEVGSISRVFRVEGDAG